ncbi:unnamed protein product [Ambrosiozyma monospora]|uniref:Unnamed protein product n=1 Tax=Ambrosiozyma monospora TaxID=43982 RepID=A0ACB5TRG3_AMBMO|nr:unnamed protein product [Ambrosiozyma monospora]
MKSVLLCRGVSENFVLTNDYTVAKAGIFLLLTTEESQPFVIPELSPVSPEFEAVQRRDSEVSDVAYTV